MANCSSDNVPYSSWHWRPTSTGSPCWILPVTEIAECGHDASSGHTYQTTDDLATSDYQGISVETVLLPPSGLSPPRQCLDVPFQTFAKKRHTYVWQCCYCAYPSIPYKATACPSCGYGRCGNCVTSKVQLK
ncbi:hypothetical protein BKA66DRAFT_266426 [Pyrenochaeta sp. MPI-SDFR-AT-0127]|nr:hypothetical protein BKA66DRAFT_266426 [Pyrenochaeta sp. MPI-SDFR-AT-0127]